MDALQCLKQELLLKLDKECLSGYDEEISRLQQQVAELNYPLSKEKEENTDTTKDPIEWVRTDISDCHRRVEALSRTIERIVGDVTAVTLLSERHVARLSDASWRQMEKLHQSFQDLVQDTISRHQKQVATQIASFENMLAENMSSSRVRLLSIVDENVASKEDGFETIQLESPQLVANDQDLSIAINRRYLPLIEEMKSLAMHVSMSQAKQDELGRQLVDLQKDQIALPRVVQIEIQKISTAFDDKSHHIEECCHALGNEVFQMSRAFLKLTQKAESGEIRFPQHPIQQVAFAAEQSDARDDTFREVANRGDVGVSLMERCRSQVAKDENLDDEYQKRGAAKDERYIEKKREARVLKCSNVQASLQRSPQTTQFIDLAPPGNPVGISPRSSVRVASPRRSVSVSNLVSPRNAVRALTPSRLGPASNTVGLQLPMYPLLMPASTPQIQTLPYPLNLYSLDPNQQCLAPPQSPRAVKPATSRSIFPLQIRRFTSTPSLPHSCQNQGVNLLQETQKREGQEHEFDADPSKRPKPHERSSRSPLRKRSSSVSGA